MPIRESQLDTWSHQGAKVTSATTYAAVKGALERAGTGYAGQIYDVFLQGSYANDTNVYGDSDIDVVIRLKGAFQPDLTDLPFDQRHAFTSTNRDATYSLQQFKFDVNAALIAAYRADVYGGTKAVHIRPSATRRETDVIAAIVHRRYSVYRSDVFNTNLEGIQFQAADRTLIVNYPEQHSTNCTRKHQATGQRFKPMVRILKNIRSHLVQNRALADGTAPSYFIEGLLFNAPDALYTGSLQNTLGGLIYWARTSNRTGFTCANGIHRLHSGDPNLFWPTGNCDAFLLAVNVLWNTWM